MPRHSDQNLYPGINGHLNSFLQTDNGGWESFHTEYLVAVARKLDTLLPANYYAVSEKSLQISATEVDVEIQRRTRPDITVYKREARIRTALQPQSVTAPTLTMPLVETLEEEEEFLNAVVIYEMVDKRFPGTPVTRLELLSPANKPPQKHHPQYLVKRKETLYSGVNLVEIDFIHEQRSVLSMMPVYPDNTDSFPYTIVVSNPHPQASEGLLEVYGIGVIDPLPTVAIPLGREEQVAFDFNEVYQRMFESVRVYSMLVDYETEPVNFRYYRRDDQEKIKALMSEIRAS